jgi:hypothetical protein
MQQAFSFHASVTWFHDAAIVRYTLAALDFIFADRCRVVHPKRIGTASATSK